MIAYLQTYTINETINSRMLVYITIIQYIMMKICY